MEVVSVHNLPTDRFLVYPFKIVVPNEFFMGMEDDVGDWRISFVESNYTGEFTSQARNRMRNSGLYQRTCIGSRTGTRDHSTRGA